MQLQGFEEARVAVLGAKELKEEYLGHTKEMRADDCLFCRISKVYKEDTVRLTMAFSASPFGMRMKQSMEMQIMELPSLMKNGEKEGIEVEWEKKSGRAPPGFQERELQKFLDYLLE